jgi:hypothetical protein
VVRLSAASTSPSRDGDIVTKVDSIESVITAADHSKERFENSAAAALLQGHPRMIDGCSA